MRPGMECFLRLLRNQPPTGSPTESEWLDVLRIAGEENLLPWLAARMSAIPTSLPDSINSSVAETRREAAQRAFAWSAALKHVLAAFHRRNIPIISLKGPWLAERLYGDAALRFYSDLDFLVRPSNWNEAEEILRELGFSPIRPSDHRHRRWGKGGINIEPHFLLTSHLDVGEMDCEKIWSRAQSGEFRGVPGWLLAPADELLYLCAHAARHRFERLNLLLDLSFAFRELPLPNLSDYRQYGPGLRNSLAISWLLAKRLENPPPVPALPSEWLQARRWLEKIANRAWQRCMVSPGWSHSSLTIHCFYLQLKTPGYPFFLRGIRYVRNLLSLLLSRGFINELDIGFTARFQLHRKWQVRILRPVRILIKAGRLSILNFGKGKKADAVRLRNGA